MPASAGWAAQSCGWCGEQRFEPGFLEDTGQAAKGYSRWVEGALELGMFGGPARLGRPRRVITAQRCTSCGHLELFAGDYS